MNLSSARVFVKEQSSAHRFYSETLGLQAIAGDPEAGFSVFNAGHAQLVVEVVPPDAPGDEQVLVGRFTGLSFAVPDLLAEYQRLVSKGVHFTGPPERQFWGGTLATFRDPAGNEFQLVQYQGAA